MYLITIEKIYIYIYIYIYEKDYVMRRNNKRGGGNGTAAEKTK